MRAGEKTLQRMSHQMGRTVPQYLKPLGRVHGNNAHIGIIFNGMAKINKLTVDLGRYCFPSQPSAYALCYIKGR